jgi:Tfp pilus assembly protein PilZ
MESLAERFPRDQRIAQRHAIKTALRVRIWKSSESEDRAESVNLSQRGIFFVTNKPFQKGEAIEILLKMPEEITGEPPNEWRCTGSITRVQPMDSPRGKFGVAVRFDCYEVASQKQPEAPVATPALGWWRGEPRQATREKPAVSLPDPQRAS